MRLHDYITGDTFDFAATDARLAELLTGADWLGAEGAYLARVGVHELLVNIRTHAYGSGPGDIELGATVTPEGVTVTVTDWGAELPDVQPEPLSDPSESGGYGLAIMDRAFSEVIYRRAMGRNLWTLMVHAQPEPGR